MFNYTQKVDLVSIGINTGQLNKQPVASIGIHISVVTHDRKIEIAVLVQPSEMQRMGISPSVNRTYALNQCLISGEQHDICDLYGSRNRVARYPFELRHDHHLACQAVNNHNIAAGQLVIITKREAETVRHVKVIIAVTLLLTRLPGKKEH